MLSPKHLGKIIYLSMETFFLLTFKQKLMQTGKLESSPQMTRQFLLLDQDCISNTMINQSEDRLTKSQIISLIFFLARNIFTKCLCYEGFRIMRFDRNIIKIGKNLKISKKIIGKL